MSTSLRESKELSYGKRNATLFIVEAAVCVPPLLVAVTQLTVDDCSLSGLSIVLLLGYMIVRGSLSSDRRLQLTSLGQYRAFVRARARGRLVEDDACDSSLFLSLMLGEALRAIGAHHII
jgi:hypothetical protein